MAERDEQRYEQEMICFHKKQTLMRSGEALSRKDKDKKQSATSAASKHSGTLTSPARQAESIFLANFTDEVSQSFLRLCFGSIFVMKRAHILKCPFFQLAKYEEMAKKDKERYRQEMDAIYEEKQALVHSDEGTSKPSGTLTSPVKRAGSSTQANSTGTFFSSMSVAQLKELQQKGVSSINKEEAMKEISAAKAFIKKRVKAIREESIEWQVKDRLLSQMMATCLAEMISGADTNVTTPESRVEYSQLVLLRTSNANQLSGLGSTVSQTSHQSLLNQLQAGGGLAAPMAPNASFFQYSYSYSASRSSHGTHGNSQSRFEI